MIKSDTFVTSSTDCRKCPQGDIPGFAFVGRSKAGKSSLINCLAGQKGLARASDKPGKTRLINHFIFNETEGPWYLVDLPVKNISAYNKAVLETGEELTKQFITSSTANKGRQAMLQFIEEVKRIP